MKRIKESRKASESKESREQTTIITII